MVYNAVPPPQGLYSASTLAQSGTPSGGGAKAPAGGQSEVKRKGKYQGSATMQQDVDWDGQQQEFVGTVPYAHGSTNKNQGPTSRKHALPSQNPAKGSQGSPPHVRSPTPNKLPLPSPGLLPTPPSSARKGYAIGRISQPVFSPVGQHRPQGKNESVPHGLQRSFQGPKPHFQKGPGKAPQTSPYLHGYQSPVQSQMTSGRLFESLGSTSNQLEVGSEGSSVQIGNKQAGALSYSAPQKSHKGLGFARSGQPALLHQQQAVQTPTLTPKHLGLQQAHAESSSTPQQINKWPSSYTSLQTPKGATAGIWTPESGGSRSPLLATPAKKIPLFNDQGYDSASRGLLMSPPPGDGLLLSSPQSRGLLIPPPPSQRIAASAPPLLRTPMDLFDEIEETFGAPVDLFSARSHLQTPNPKTPTLKPQNPQTTPVLRRPPTFTAPSPALLKTPGNSCLTTAKQVREAAAAAWAMVSTPGLLPSPARPGSVLKTPAGSASPARAPYPEHWRAEEISQGVKRGELFRAVLRVNAFKRMEAYVTIEGVGTDVMIDGLIAQNRAIEGDTVYIKVHPSSKWPLLRGTKPEDAKSESSSLSGLSSVLENLNLGTSRGGMFGLDDSSDDVSDRGSSERESLGEETSDVGSFGSPFSAPEGSANGRDGSEERGPRGGVGGVVEGGAEDAVGQVDVQRELDELFSQLAGGNQGSGEKGPTGAEDSVKVGAGNFTDGFDALGLGSTPPLNVGGGGTTSEPAGGDDLDVAGGDLISSDGVSGKECRPTATSQAVERLAAELKAAPNRRPTGFVVGIAEFSARREALVGYLQFPSKPSKPAADTPVKGLFRDNDTGSPTVTAFTSPSVTLMPADPRMPKMTVWVDGLPDGLKERVREGDPSVNTTLVAARIDCWKAQHYQPLATVRQSLGQAGEIETETAAIMFMHNIHGPDFPKKALECLPATPWTIPRDEIARRRDLRGERIFTIDPPTARDLDDAVSVKRLGNGNFEVGVHIADVSFFVAPGTGLDKEARRRSTSVYLIQRVLPMLSPLLCEQLCSLNPGVDRLAFSVIWELTPRGEIVRQWMGRTVITSCCKLAYGHAQAMIDGRFDLEAGVNGPQTGPVPPALHGAHAWDDVIDDVIALNGLACEMRRARFESGALRLDNTKLTFRLDADGNPDGVLVYESLDANKLIEEFMLLANRSVAGAICRAFPESALLRRHPPPNERKLEEFAKMCEAHGLEVNLGSAGALHASLEEIKRATAHDGAIADVIRLGATKPMNLAKYFCTGELLGAPEDWGHYALATPLYTHFTSPIRRYPDLVVHRTLAAALEAEKSLQGGSADFFGGFESLGTGHVGNPQPFTGPVGGDALGALLTWHEKLWAEEERRERKAEKAALKAAGKAHGVPENSDLQGVATYCNERKMASKQAQEASDKVFLCVLLKRRRGMVSDARVVSIGPKWATVYILRFGLERRIYFEDLSGAQAEFFESTKTVVVSEVRESHRSAKKAAKKVAGKEEYGYVLAEEAAELGVEAAVLPLTLKMLSSVPVVCYAITGNNRPMDVGVRLYL